MTPMKMMLLAGALTVVGSGAFAQTMAPTSGVNFRTLNERAYVAKPNRALDSYASAYDVRTPISRATPRGQIDPRDLAAGYVTGGGVSYR